MVPIVAPAPVTSVRARLIADPAYAFRSVAALAAIGVTLLGAVPMTAAWAAGRADPILAQAVDGLPRRWTPWPPPSAWSTRTGAR